MGKIFISILIFGLIMGLGTLFIFTHYKDISLPKAQTVAFTTLVMFQMFAVLSSRSLYPSLKKLNPFSNLWLLGAVALSVLIQIVVIYWAPLQLIFGTVPLLQADWIKILLLSAGGFVVMEISKFFMGKKKVEQRKFKRYSYKPDCCPILDCQGVQYKVLNISEGGLKIEIELKAEINSDSYVFSGDLCLFDGRHIHVSGKQVWIIGNEIGIKLNEPISKTIIDSEFGNFQDTE